MKRLLSMSAAVLATAIALSAGASAQVTSLPLPAPPAAGNAAASTIFDAMLAIARTVGSNPAAAQQATFSYNAAIQQYNAGDLARSRSSALQAIMQTAAVPQPQPTLYAPPIPMSSYVPMPNVLGASQADAEGYVALARSAMSACGAPGTKPSDAIQQQYSAAVAALTTQNLGAARTASMAVIDGCATVGAAYAKQLQAQPAPSIAPPPAGAYSPVPIATLGPDPALQQAPAATPMTSPSPDNGRRNKM
jgi:hypothetical protein